MLATLQAQTTNAFALDIRKKYERELIRWALDRRALVVDPHPEGKTIDKIYVVREEIFAKSDPWPSFINVFHVKTRDYIVRQEMLLKPGQRYESKRIAETERNLRRLAILAVARIVAVKAKAPDRVSLLVATKDLWSIRLNMTYNQTGSLVSLLDLNPSERNFLGHNKTLAARIRISQLDLDGFRLFNNIGVGLSYFDDRLFRSRLRLTSSATLFIDGDVPCGGGVGEQASEDPRAWCPDGKQLGATARLRIERPIYSLGTHWGFAIDATLTLLQSRLYTRNDRGVAPRPGQRRGVSLATRTFDNGTAADPSDDRHVPFVFDTRRLVLLTAFTRRFGFSTQLRHDLSWGLLTYQIDNDSPNNFGFDKSTRDWFEGSVLARSEAASALFIKYNLSSTRFVRLRNVASFALSEDYAVGPSAELEVRLGQNLVTSSQNFIELFAKAGYQLYLGGDLLSLSLTAQTRLQRGLSGDQSPWVNNELKAAISNASPRLWIGRLHVLASVALRRDDLDRRFAAFDDDVVRGYGKTTIFGRNVFRVSAEYRTVPLNLWTLHFGGVLFYDGGSVWGAPGPGQRDEPFEENFRHAVGVGLRALFPQFDRQTLRVDFGVPLSALLDPDVPNTGAGSWFSLTFGQFF